MSVQLQVSINWFSSVLLIADQVFCTDVKCFWPFNCKNLPSVKSKLNSAIGVD